jgi:alpha-1,3-glucan synthase
VLGYSPLDFTVLDPHYGTLAEWQNAIDAIHAHNMYLMVDFTVGTMGDLVGFQESVQVNSALKYFVDVFQIFEYLDSIRSQ